VADTVPLVTPGDPRPGGPAAAVAVPGAGAPPSRVLVVDDEPQMRILIQRALAACGCETDTASTLAEARLMDAGSYDAVLVDARIGTERGADLIESMMARDPAAASRCLVITGGAVEPLPGGVVCLTKPFQLTDLIGAVRALLQPGPVSAAAPPAGPATAPAGTGETAPAGAATAPAGPATAPTGPAGSPATLLAGPAGSPAAAREPRTWRLLDLTRRLRGYERRALTDFLHDGPIQELTALSLELQMMARSAGPAGAPPFDALIERLNAASGALRWLIDESWSFLTPDTNLAAAIAQRTSWLLSEPVTLDTGPGLTALSAAEIQVIVDVVELLLLGLMPPGQPILAHVALRANDHLIGVEGTITAADGRELSGSPATAQASLDELASALGASVRAALDPRRWHARIALPT